MVTLALCFERQNQQTRKHVKKKLSRFSTSLKSDPVGGKGFVGKRKLLAKRLVTPGIDGIWSDENEARGARTRVELTERSDGDGLTHRHVGAMHSNRPTHEKI